MIKTVASRMFKQSVGPAVVAVGYAIWKHWPLPGVSVSDLIGSVAGGFFLTSWFAGQVLRTSKQVHDEERFNTIITRLDGFDAQSLANYKSAASDHIDLLADLMSLQVSVKLLVPDHIKAMIFSMLLEQGERADAPHVKPWAVSAEVLEAGRMALREAALRAASKEKAQG